MNARFIKIYQDLQRAELVLDLAQQQGLIRSSAGETKALRQDIFSTIDRSAGLSKYVPAETTTYDEGYYAIYGEPVFGEQGEFLPGWVPFEWEGPAEGQFTGDSPGGVKNYTDPTFDAGFRKYLIGQMQILIDRVKSLVGPHWGPLQNAPAIKTFNELLGASGAANEGASTASRNSIGSSGMQLLPGTRGFAGVGPGGTQRSSDWQMASGRGSDSSGGAGGPDAGNDVSPHDQPTRERAPGPAPKHPPGTFYYFWDNPNPGPIFVPDDRDTGDDSGSGGEGEGGGGSGDDGGTGGADGDDRGTADPRGGGDDGGGGGDDDAGGMADPEGGTDDTRPGPRKGQLGADMTPGHAAGGVFGAALAREAVPRIGPMLATRIHVGDPSTDRGGNNPHYFSAYEKPNPDDPHPVGPQARSSRSARNPAGYYWKPNPDDPSGGIGPRSYGARAAMSSAASIAAFRAVRSAIVSGMRRGSGG